MISDPSTWVDAHGDRLFRYALSRIRDASAAEDLVQETLLAALKSRDRFKGESSELTWMTGIMRNKIFEHRACAEAMGIPPGRLAVLLYRARLRLRRCLERALFAPEAA